MNQSIKGTISQLFFAIAFIVAVGFLIFIANLVTEYKDNVASIRNNNADQFLKSEQHLGNMTSISGDVIYFDEQFVTLHDKNQFARSDDLTLKTFVIEDRPLTYLCAEDLCAYVSRTNIVI